MSPRTVFLSKLAGLYYLLAALAMISRKQATVEAVNGIVRNPPVMFFAAVVALIAGLAIVIGHNVWKGGAVPVIVTLIGWITLIKGLLFLLLTPEAAAGVFAALHYEQLFYLYAGICLVLGAYLSYGGFRSAPS